MRVCVPIEVGSFINFNQPSVESNRWWTPGDQVVHYRGCFSPLWGFGYREKLRFHAVRVHSATDEPRVCSSLGILQTGKLTLIGAIWFQGFPSPLLASQRRGNLVRSCGIISRIDISQNPQPPHLPIYTRSGRSITGFTFADPWWIHFFLHLKLILHKTGISPHKLSNIVFLYFNKDSISIYVGIID